MNNSHTGALASGGIPVSPAVHDAAVRGAAAPRVEKKSASFVIDETKRICYPKRPAGNTKGAAPAPVSATAPPRPALGIRAELLLQAAPAARVVKKRTDPASGVPPVPAASTSSASASAPLPLPVADRVPVSVSVSDSGDVPGTDWRSSRPPAPLLSPKAKLDLDLAEQLLKILTFWSATGAEHERSHMNFEKGINRLVHQFVLPVALKPATKKYFPGRDEAVCGECKLTKLKNDAKCGGRECGRKEGASVGASWRARVIEHFERGLYDALSNELVEPNVGKTKPSECPGCSTRLLAGRRKGEKQCGGSQCIDCGTSTFAMEQRRLYARCASEHEKLVVRVYLCDPQLVEPRKLADKLPSADPLECESLRSSYLTLLMCHVGMQLVQLPHHPNSGQPERILAEHKTEQRMSVAAWPALAPRFVAETGHFTGPGGYYVVNGMSKVLLPVQEQASNVIMTATGTSSVRATATVRSTDGIQTSSVTVAVNWKRETGEQAFVQCSLGSSVPLVALLWLFGVKNEMLKRFLQEHSPVDQKERALEFAEANIAHFNEELSLQHFGKRSPEEALDIDGDVSLEQMYGELAAKENDPIKAAREYFISQTRKTHKDDAPAEFTRREKRLFCHLNVFLRNDSEWRSRCGIYLLEMTAAAFRVARGVDKPSDKDLLQNKRSIFCGEVFRRALNELLQAAGELFVRIAQGSWRARWTLGHGLPKLQKLFAAAWPQRLITKRLLSSMSTGRWTFKQYTHAGVSQAKETLNTNTVVSQVTRMLSSVRSETPQVAPRLILWDQAGFFCPSEIQEGQAIGLVKQMAVTAICSIGARFEDVAIMIRELLGIHKPFDLADWQQFKGIRVYLEGVPLGIRAVGDSKIEKAMEDTIKLFREKRSAEKLLRECSYSYNVASQKLEFRCGHGRMMRPLFVEQSQADFRSSRTAQKLLGLDQKGGADGREKAMRRFMDEKETESLMEELIRGCYIEYVDAEEMQNCVVAQFPHELATRQNTAYTHCEIHPAAIFGHMAIRVIHATVSNPQRTSLAAGYGRSAIALPGTEPGLLWGKAFSKKSKYSYLHYGQAPVIATAAHGAHEVVDSTNMVVAFLAVGNNQDDGIIVKRQACERSALRHSRSKKYTVTIDPSKGLLLGKLVGRKNHSKLELDGLPAAGAVVFPGEALVGIYRVVNKEIDDCSVHLHKLEQPGVVGKVLCSWQKDQTVVHVFVRNECPLQKGDKLSVGANKGVVTNVVDEYDMPWTQDGITPDIILNPVGLAKRGLANLPLAVLQSKLAVLAPDRPELREATSFSGLFGNGDPMAWSEWQMNLFKFLCEEQGIPVDGKQVMYTGKEGKRMQNRVLIGLAPCFKLRQIVAEKVHARSTGPKDQSGHALKGKANEGGGRTGEQERDAILASGAMALLYDRTMGNSDALKIAVCGACGLFPPLSALNTVYQECRYCKATITGESLRVISTSCGFLDLYEFLAGMGIQMRVHLKEEVDTKKPTNPPPHPRLDILDGPLTAPLSAKQSAATSMDVCGMRTKPSPRPAVSTNPYDITAQFPT